MTHFFSTSDQSSGASLVTLSLDLVTFQALTVKSHQRLDLVFGRTMAFTHFSNKVNEWQALL